MPREDTNNFGKSSISVPLTDFYPASGFRYNISGTVGSVGTYGFAWSSSPISATGTYGSNFYFRDGAISPEDPSNCRATGFPVRCVQE